MVLLLAELFARIVGAHLPPLLTGDGLEMKFKYERVTQLAHEPVAQQPQVVFFGNSMTDAGVSPEVFLAASTKYRRAYNAALIGAPVESESRWAQHFVLDQLHPQLVVVGVSPLDLLDVNPLDLLDVTQGQGRSQAVESAFDSTLDQVRPSSLQRLEQRADSISALVKYRSSFRDPRMLGRAISDTILHRPPRKGIPEVATVADNKVVPRDATFWRTYLRPSGGTQQFEYRRLDETRDPDLEHRIASAVARADYLPSRLTQLLTSVAAKGRQVVVVIPPVAVTTLDGVKGAVARYEAGAELIASIASRYGDRVVDFSHTQYPLDLFADVAHLNGPGSDRFSKDLSQAINSI